MIVDINSARDMFPAVYEIAAEARPGTYSRNQTYWDLRFWPSELKNSLFVVYQESGQMLGYVIYESRGNWES